MLSSYQYPTVFSPNITKKNIKDFKSEGTNWNVFNNHKIVWINNDEIGNSNFCEQAEIFEFMPLKEIRDILLSNGYSVEEVGRTINGLSELSEYGNKSIKTSSK